MRRFAAILFFTAYLTSTTEASQLLKLPVILQHFHEHQQRNPGISFFKFLDMHYLHGSPHDEDYERDMQLPFKRADHHAHVPPVTVPRITEIDIPATYTPGSCLFILVNDDRLYYTDPVPIFQPPRILSLPA